MRDDWGEEQGCHNMNEVLGQLICDVKLVTLTQLVSFSLGHFAVFSLHFLVKLLQFGNDNSWFEQSQHRSCYHVDTQKNISFINQSSGIEPFISVVSIDPNENQCGVEETQNS